MKEENNSHVRILRLRMLYTVVQNRKYPEHMKMDQALVLNALEDKIFKLMAER